MASAHGLLHLLTAGCGTKCECRLATFMTVIGSAADSRQACDVRSRMARFYSL
jgi:hypothetical protein